MKSNQPKILYYDIETTPLLAYIWRTGKQVVRHSQLAEQRNEYRIICICYCWNDSKAPKALIWDHRKQDCTAIVKEFDALIKQADVVIGKNSNSFDNRHLNAQRMLTGGTPMPDWVRYTDDLERQMRKYFYLPSFSLDYISKILGLGGKLKMELQDWIDIVEDRKGERGTKALKKMVRYGKKDIADTRALWEYLEGHFETRFNHATFLMDKVCVTCGSCNIIKNGTRISGKTRYQLYFCNEHGGYAGRAPISTQQQKEGRLG